MGKSKFPGKPSKLVHKRRVSVLQVEGDSRDIESGEITQNSLPTTTTTTSNGGKVGFFMLTTLNWRSNLCVIVLCHSFESIATI